MVKTMKVQAIIPAAGLGTRLRPLTLTMPKALVPVAGKPMIVHIIDELVKSGIQDYVIIVGFLGNVLEDYLKKKYPKLTLKFVYQKKMGGTAQAVYLAEPYIKNPCLIIYGDTMIKGDLSPGLAFNSDMTLGTKFIDDPRPFGTVERENGRIARLVEKPNYIKRSEVLVGVYTVRNYKLMFQCIKELMDNKMRFKNEFYLTHALQIMLEKGASAETFQIEDWYDCGNFKTLLDTNRKILESKRRFKNPIVKDGCIIIPPVSIGSDVKLRSSIIGPYASIGDNVVIENSLVSDTIISDGCQVKNSVVEKSALGRDASILGRPVQAFLGDTSQLG
jgi:glucose-1-phosphate thymidylyltransferase